LGLMNHVIYWFTLVDKHKEKSQKSGC